MAVKRSKDYNLEQRNSTWYVVLDVPPSMRDAMGRKRLRKSTGTTDKLKARLVRDSILGDLRRQITQRGTNGAGQGWQQEAVEWRKEIEGQHDDELRAGLEHVLHDKALEIERSKGFPKAKAFYDIASGQSTPIALHHEAWLQERQFAARQVSDYRNQVRRLADWMVDARLTPSLEAITDKIASRFKQESLVAAGVNTTTANKWLSGLRSYWRWLVSAGHASHNPWLGKSLPKSKQVKDNQERPLTDTEMQLLLAGKPDDELRAAILISALSGMRIEEIFRLQVRHCKDGIFQVAYGYAGKTDAATREVPIHSALRKLVDSLCKGRGDADYILQGSDGGWGKTRSMACSKRFTTYRRRCGVDEMIEGKRRSLVNFHSLRRWFTTKADQAGHREQDVARVMGHTVQGMTFGTYSGGMTMEQRRCVVESVQLPPPRA